MATKPWWQSWTVWINVFTVALNELTNAMPQEYAVPVLAVVNLLLRVLKTTGPVTLMSSSGK